jgi:hypothetical protein
MNRCHVEQQRPSVVVATADGAVLASSVPWSLRCVRGRKEDGSAEAVAKELILV